MSTEIGEAELWRHYDRVLAEYRFQVELNWKRTQYFFALNIAVVAAGIGLLSSAGKEEPGVLVTLFLVGIGLALFALAAGRRQHEYYQHARDLKTRVEDELSLGDLALLTTPGMGAPSSRWPRVQLLQDWMFALIAGVNISGLVVTLC